MILTDYNGKLKHDRHLAIPCQDQHTFIGIGPGMEKKFQALMLGAFSELGYDTYAVENEEKEPGWPDALVMSSSGLGTVPVLDKVVFIEFKVSDSNGVIHFEKTQPLFYKRNYALPIYIIAYDCHARIPKLIMPYRVVAARTRRLLLQTGCGLLLVDRVTPVNRMGR